MSIWTPVTTTHWIETVSGFILDNTPHYFTVRDGENTTLTIANTPFSGIEIHKIDSVTGKGIYGAKFLLYDGDKKPVGEYVTDQNGYIYIDDLTHDGKYFIRELECEGYVIDTQLKTVMVKAGQIVKLSDYDKPASIGVSIKKVGNREVQPGTSMRYDFSDIANTSNVALNNFYWHDRIPTDATNAMSLTTGTYNQRLY